MQKIKPTKMTNGELLNLINMLYEKLGHDEECMYHGFMRLEVLLELLIKEDGLIKPDDFSAALKIKHEESVKRIQQMQAEALEKQQQEKDMEQVTSNTIPLH